MALSPLFTAPADAPWLAPWREGLAQGEFRLPRCSVCGAWEWYPDAAGPACAGGHYVWHAISGRGAIFTFTHVRRPLLPGVSDPYWVGLVAPDEAPHCRIPALLEGDESTIAIGARVTLRFGPDQFPYFAVEVNP